MSIGRFSNNPEFKRMLEEKQSDILRRTNDGIQETWQFQQLLSLFAECRRKNKECDYRLILISKTDLLNLCSDAEVKVQELFHLHAFLTNRTVRVDSNFSVLSNNNDVFPNNNNDARRYFAALSNTAEDLIAFHVAPNATINYFIDGSDYGDGVFYTLEAQSRYEELKPIEQLEKVLDEYRVNLTHQDTYLKFFVPKAGLRALRISMKSTENEKTFLEDYKHLLNFDAMKAADICVLCLPCGRSAHLEAGWMKGAGKKVIAFIPPDHRIEPELMYGMLDGIALCIQDLVNLLKGGQQ